MDGIKSHQYPEIYIKTNARPSIQVFKQSEIIQSKYTHYTELLQKPGRYH